MTREERFEVAMTRLVEEVGDWNDLLNDPFKAPELKVGLPRAITAATWELGLAWTVLTEEREVRA